jgi:acyl-homoserine lactone acylase PvdQ
MADDDKIYQTLTLGQSGHILSAHRNDQLRSWLNSEPHAIGFSEKQIERQLQHTLVLTNRSE